MRYQGTDHNLVTAALFLYILKPLQFEIPRKDPDSCSDHGLNTSVLQPSCKTNPLQKEKHSFFIQSYSEQIIERTIHSWSPLQGTLAHLIRRKISQPPFYMCGIPAGYQALLLQSLQVWGNMVPSSDHLVEGEFQSSRVFVRSLMLEEKTGSTKITNLQF